MENNNNGMKKKKEKDGEIIINTGVDKNDVSIEMKNKSKKQQPPPSLKSAKSGLKSGLSIPIPERKLSNFGVMHRSTPIQSPITNYQSSATSHQPPITNHQSLITSYQSPIINH